MACNKQFENLFTILDNSQYELDTPFKKVIQEAVEKAGFCEQPKEVKGTQKGLGKKGGKGGKKRKVSSYNAFVGHQIKIEGKTMAQAGPLWKQLGEKEKLVWKEKADLLNQEEEEGKEKGNDKTKENGKDKGKEKKKSEKIRKTSGYNLFIGDQIKNRGKKMGEAVTLWKELSEKEKQVWKDKAVIFNQEKEHPKKNVSESESDSE